MKLWHGEIDEWDFWGGDCKPWLCLDRADGLPWAATVFDLPPAAAKIQLKRSVDQK